MICYLKKKYFLIFYYNFEENIAKFRRFEHNLPSRLNAINISQFVKNALDNINMEEIFPMLMFCKEFLSS